MLSTARTAADELADLEYTDRTDRQTVTLHFLCGCDQRNKR